MAAHSDQTSESVGNAGGANSATGPGGFSKQQLSQMQPMYARMVPSGMIEHGVTNPLIMQRTVSVQP